MSEIAPRVPSAWQLERAVSAWQQIRERLLDQQFTIDENAIAAALAEADAQHPQALLERLIDAEVWAELREAEADNLRDRMTERRDRYRGRAATIRAAIVDLMAALEIKTQRATLATATVSAGRVGVRITDPDKLADQYVTVTVTRNPDRTAIRADLDEGVVIEGAELSNPAPILTIRRA